MVGRTQWRNGPLRGLPARFTQTQISVEMALMDENGQTVLDTNA